MRVTTAARQVQSVSFRTLTDTGEVEQIHQIERDSSGRMFVRTALGRLIAAERIISIIRPDDA